jgi:protein RecA
MEKTILDKNSSSVKDAKDHILKTLKALKINEKSLVTGETAEPNYIPTGVPEIDAILAPGMGLPEGVVVEFAGETQSGKTWLAYKVIAEAQKLGKVCVFLNVEGSYLARRAESCGVNIQDLIIIENVGSAERYGEIALSIAESGQVGVIVIDSITAMVPNTELEKSLEDVATIGSHSRFVKRFMSKLIAECSSTDTLAIIVNQLYLGSGAMPGSMVKTASGGNAMNYFTGVRLWVNKINGAAGKITRKDENGNDEVVGGKSICRVEKARYSQPGLTCEFRIPFGTDEQPSFIDEFLFKAKARGFEFIKEVRKKFTYVHPDTAEVVESKDKYEFCEMLMNLPAPSNKTKNDNSNNVFDYICGRTKISHINYQKLIAEIQHGPEDSDVTEEG